MVNMQQITDGAQSDTSGAQTLRKTTTMPCVGSLTRNLPAYVRNPPIEAVRPVAWRANKSPFERLLHQAP